MVLLDPPFNQGVQDPGYIMGYPPGIRENGGQYNHAAVWVVMALAKLGSGDEAAELFHLLNPINRTRTKADVERYKGEPYVMAGDVSAHPQHLGRAGWTWYTRPAGWMYRAGLESILGLRRRGATFTVDPCIPGSWSEFSLSWRLGETRYEIAVENPQHVCRGVRSAELDGTVVDAKAIAVIEDGQLHRVRGWCWGDRPARLDFDPRPRLREAPTQRPSPVEGGEGGPGRSRIAVFPSNRRHQWT